MTRLAQYEESLHALAASHDEIRAEAGRYGDQCEYTQETLRSIRTQARDTVAAAKREGLSPRIPTIFQE